MTGWRVVTGERWRGVTGERWRGVTGKRLIIIIDQVLLTEPKLLQHLKPHNKNTISLKGREKGRRNIQHCRITPLPPTHTVQPF